MDCQGLCARKEASGGDVIAFREPHTAKRRVSDLDRAFDYHGEERIQLGLISELSRGLIQDSRLFFALARCLVEPRVPNRDANLLSNGREEPGILRGKAVLTPAGDV